MDYNLSKGTFLIANPVLPDPNFSRTVVLLCNHDDQGSFGLVVNRLADLKASEIFSNLDFINFEFGNLYLGGPVSQSQIFFLCRSNAAIPELESICDGVHLGMNPDSLEKALEKVDHPERDIRFYLGYSGWGTGQLDGEMEQKSWLTCEAKDNFVFAESQDSLWAIVVKSMGKEYEYLIHAPENPQWN